MKQCSKCNQNLPLSEFHKLSQSRDGLAYQCKECKQKDTKLRTKRYIKMNEGRIYGENEFKQCTQCKQTLPLTEFDKNSNHRDGLTSVCKKCIYISQKTYREKNQDKIQAYLKKNKDRIKIRNKIYRENNREKRRAYSKLYDKNHKEYFKEQAKKIKIIILSHYSNGTMKCAICDWDDVRALTIDHINNNGAEERKKYGEGLTFYNWLIKNDFPIGYQVLCRNCNWIKYLEDIFKIKKG